jgi:hypothetical protein
VVAAQGPGFAAQGISQQRSSVLGEKRRRRRKKVFSSLFFFFFVIRVIDDKGNHRIRHGMHCSPAFVFLT